MSPGAAPPGQGVTARAHRTSRSGGQRAERKPGSGHEGISSDSTLARAKLSATQREIVPKQFLISCESKHTGKQVAGQDGSCAGASVSLFPARGWVREPYRFC